MKGPAIPGSPPSEPLIVVATGGKRKEREKVGTVTTFSKHLTHEEMQKVVTVPTFFFLVPHACFFGC